MSRHQDNLVKNALNAATRWLSVSDLEEMLAIPGSSIRRLLNDPRNNKLFISFPNLGRCGQKEWAAVSKNTTNWSHSPSQTTSAKKKASLPRRVKTSVNKTRKVEYLPAHSKPSLVQAIADLIKTEFIGPANHGKEFTAYDITRRLRDNILKDVRKSGDLKSCAVKSEETGTIAINGWSVPRIDHLDVRTIVHGIFESRALRGVIRTSEKLSDGTNYWLYKYRNPSTEPKVATVEADDPIPVLVKGYIYPGMF